MSKRLVRRLMRTGTAAAVVLGLTGCPQEAADITEIVATILDFDIAATGTIVFPGGAAVINSTSFIDFNPTLQNAFGKAVAGNDPFYASMARGDPDDGTDFGPGWNFDGFLRNSTNDPRLPALTENDAVLPAGDGFVIGDPNEVGGDGFHNPFTEGLFTGLMPTTTYVVAFARLGTTVNGELDQQLILEGRPLDAPDALDYVGGAPGGNPTVPIVSFPTFIPFVANANPYVLGNFTTDGTGAGFFDVVVDGTGGGLYQTSDGDPSDSDFDLSLVARNDDVVTSFPRYNYLIIFEGPAVDAADAADNPQAVRLQMAQDFDASSGALLNNAYAPFPTDSVTQAEKEAGLPGSAVSPDDVTIEGIRLEALAGNAVYKAWLMNRDEDPVTMTEAIADYDQVVILREIDPITGEILSESDSVVGSTAATSTFTGLLSMDVPGKETPQEVKHRLTVTDALVGTRVGFFTDVVVTIEESPGATSPSDAKVLWFQYTEQQGTPSDFFDDVPGPSVGLFGNFDPVSGSRVVGPGAFAQSSGRGGVLDDEVSVEINNLPRPPVGYFYEGWLTGPAGTLSLGEIMSLPPELTSLLDADSDLSLPGVTENGIRFAVTRAAGLDPETIVSADGTINYTTYFLTIEPKLGAVGKNIGDLEVGSLPTTAIIGRRD